MTYRVRYTKGARNDLHRLYAQLQLLEPNLKAARRARDAIAKDIEMLGEFPFTCRKALVGNPFLRELVIPFVMAGYVVLFEIEDNDTFTILVVRYQREDDYH
ncbi:MAG: type II toxin-antitoxin system RelE/ParE family toxin [Glaciimonas sp.]|nr:type II toxin-antitoxin system RelE/ParE family toxin [Glaciimonas sp.]